MNIFGSVLSVEAMKTRTSGGEGCDSPGDYLRYDADLILIVKMRRHHQLGRHGVGDHWRGHRGFSGFRSTVSEVIMQPQYYSYII